ncbi:hypothetical protein [Amycolatopsis sp. H20-H5]|uniref:hypothetical protein n=1 Tax=Amycolatopsis sp. H20-H5 TaxID=3046309 RepID=UPI002DB868F4|nr:hypothetical protein [Amycolatopsis sp. H20-H5]MEC3975933.1 hypothetical protein [Amycolatopsis sp. H20-H5]
MSIHICESEMTSSRTEHRATATEDGWHVSWLPGRVLDRNSAITAMTLVEIYADNPPKHSKWWLAALNFEQELGLDERDRP